MTSTIAASEFVYSRLKDDICRGEILPGERLITDRLAARYNVSRTPVREAIKKLENDGLAVTTRNSGAVIQKKSLEYICDLFDVRTELECLAVLNLCRRKPDKKELAQLRECCEALVNSETFGDQEKADLDFHMALCRISHMQPLVEIMENHLILLAAFKLSPQVASIRSVARDNVAREEHTQLTDAICNNNEAEACRLIRKHLTSAKEYLLSQKKK